MFVYQISNASGAIYVSSKKKAVDTLTYNYGHEPVRARDNTQGRGEWLTAEQLDAILHGKEPIVDVSFYGREALGYHFDRYTVKRIAVN